MKIVIDDKIPYIKNVFEPFGEVIYMPGKYMTNEIVKDANCLVTRTRAQCNESLLNDSSVSFIATATIGFDHIDTKYCDDNFIKWQNAPGCNAYAVVQYFFTAMHHLAIKNNFDLKDKVLGIVGVGNVGSRIAKVAESIGMSVLKHDPPRAEREGDDEFTPLNTIAKEADIITYHTPLTKSGKYPTHHLFDEAFAKTLQRKPIIINAARGGIMHDAILPKALKAGYISDVVIDCWETEPIISPQLLKQVSIATPHIAGYSLEGKANATRMTVQSISRQFNLGLDSWDVELPAHHINENSDADRINLIAQSYDIMKDDQSLRENPDQFEKLRNNYNFRRESGLEKIEN